MKENDTNKRQAIFSRHYMRQYRVIYEHACVLLLLNIYSWGTAFPMVARLRAGRPAYRGSIPVRSRWIFSYPKVSRPAPEIIQPPIQRYKEFFPRE